MNYRELVPAFLRLHTQCLKNCRCLRYNSGMNDCDFSSEHQRAQNRLESFLAKVGVRADAAIKAYCAFVSREGLYSLYLDETCSFRRKYFSKVSGTQIRRTRSLFESLGLVRVISNGRFRNRSSTRIEIDLLLRDVMGYEFRTSKYSHRTILERRIRAKNP